jgi:outer membrane autotransporter protein
MPSRWSVWAAGYGGQVDANGGSGSGSHDRSEQSFGYATGADYRVTPNTKIGFAIAGGAAQFGVADGLGGGRSNLFQAAVYSVTNFGSAYVAAALAYGWNDVSTDRYVTIGGNDHLTASFAANDFDGQIEGGYRFGWLIPYASVGVQDFRTPSYTETAASGTPTFALSYAAHDTVATRTQIGLRTEQAFALNNGMALVLNSRAAWVHDFSAAPSVDASFISLPGSHFTVVGAAEPADSLLASARAELKLGNGFSVAGSVETQLAGGYASWYGLGQVRYTW